MKNDGAMEKNISNIVVTVGGDNYKFEAPEPDLTPGCVRMEHLADDVREGLDELNNVALTEQDLEGIFHDEDTVPGGSPAGNTVPAGSPAEDVPGGSPAGNL